ncbi:Piwi-domain-containing protein [Basidiobolus meristosporus CBS 931.73]|uniref:Piwi-domain-containing protein n=1 Tax=Basidiobolus meristosporus CBS 931.73 TaxID=1314790 RepID=A0A1Y1YHC8_9FUNG|nr:Piwi-domain-containing protein [Basidiobolus meristosporus CBS 931.73]|eukprot:ORX97422.1 Piwi-domain-containing protein [Basidiobolus meristosporus CBS 931.73]
MASSQRLVPIKFPKRPGIGTAGQKIRVRANYFDVICFPGANIHHYDVTIIPDVPATLCRQIYQLFEDLNSTTSLGGIKPIYDGRKNIFSHKPLPFGDHASFTVTLPEDSGSSSKREPREFTIKLVKVGVVVMEELNHFLSGKISLTSNCQTAIMALDILIRHRPSMLYSSIGSSFFTNTDSRPLGNGVDVWQGFYQSARPTPRKMMINVDVSSTAFYHAGPLVQTVVQILGFRGVEDLKRGLTPRDHAKLEKGLKNLGVMVVHRGQDKRKYKIRRLSLKGADQETFGLGESGSDVSTVASYFQKRYNLRLAYPFLPCIVVKKKEIMFPMEVCEVVPGQKYIRKLNERQTQEMIKFTCQPPHIRANKIHQGLKVLNYRDNEYLQQFGMKIGNEMAVIDARILPAPTVCYNESSKEAKFVPRGGAWNLRDKKVAAGATIASWSVAVFGAQRDFPLNVVQHFIKELSITCVDTGMIISHRSPPIGYFPYHVQGNNIEQALSNAWYKAGDTTKKKPQLIICILPNTGVQLYGEIKRVSDTVLGVATQCVQGKHVFKANKQYCANVCLKINAKLGGMNSYLPPEQIPFISNAPTIVFGADVTHPGPGENNKPSIAAVVASMDNKVSRYASCIRAQASRTEIIADLAAMVQELLVAFYKSCRQKPAQILFYRDGVSEGQFGQVLHAEVKAVQAACRLLEKDYNPKLTFVIVQKRHHARFFPMDKSQADRSGNCIPGTVVDTNITHPYEFDFYLQSHAGIQGTSRSTHYHVLYDDNNFTSNSLQELTYRLCYLYARCTRSVSVVPAAYYADLVCTRARFHARGGAYSESDLESEDGEGLSYAEVKPDLQNVMYFM